MKLMLCRKCTSVISLHYAERECVCGACKGRYEPDGHHATYSGPAVMIGFANSSFVRAIVHQPKSGAGERFEAFVIPVECEIVTEEKNDI